MNLLMITHHLSNGGGSYIRVYSLAKALAARGHQITLLASSRANQWREYRDAGIQIVESPGVLPEKVRHGGLDFTEVLARLRFLNRQRFDLIHGFGHRPSVSIPASITQHRCGTPYIVDWADLWGKGGIADERTLLARISVGLFDHLLEPWANRQAAGLTVICSDLHRRAKTLGIPDESLCMLPVGASVDMICVLDRDQMRAKHNLPLDAHIAVFSGYAPYDADLLGHAFLELARRDERAHLLVTGEPPARLLDVLQGVPQGRVTIAGVVAYQQLGEFLACGDVMLLPYRDREVNRARSPGKIGDYLAAGRPVITNPTGDLAEMIHNEQVGVLVEETPQSFAEAALALFNDPQQRQQLGKNARRTAEEKLDWRHLAANLEVFYLEMLQNA